MKRNNLILSFFVCCTLCAVCCSDLFADKIYLKNGKVYDGKLIGRSPRRYLFALGLNGDSVQLSFFTEDVDKIELGKNTVEEQIPYLKEVESLKVAVNEEKPKTYELSLYNKNPTMTTQSFFPEAELKRLLTKEEYEYYKRFNEILSKYEDKFVFIENLYSNLTTASKDDFASAKEYSDELYFELSNIVVPDGFRSLHTAYLRSVKATFLAFNALDQGKLDEASKQIKISEEARLGFIDDFRKMVDARKAEVGEALPQAEPCVQEPSAQP